VQSVSGERNAADISGKLVQKTRLQKDPNLMKGRTRSDGDSGKPSVIDLVLLKGKQIWAWEKVCRGPSCEDE